MKNLFFLFAVFISHNTVQAQKKTNKIIPPKITQQEIRMVSKDETKKCFVYSTKEPKNDSMLLETKRTLEYDESDNNARIVINSKEYDPIKDQQAKKEGNRLVWQETAELINGTYKIENSILTFTPEKLNNNEVRTFKLVYKQKTKNLDYLKDKVNNKYAVGNCSKPIVSMGL